MAAINLPKIALGAWAWGNDGTFGSGIAAGDLKPVFDAATAAGLNLWDTAFAYGAGASERVLGSFLQGLPRELEELAASLQINAIRFWEKVMD